MSDIMENGKRKKRTLPSWMTKKDRCDDSKKPDNNDEEEVRTKAKQARVLPACFFEGFSDSKLPLLQYRGMISYSTHKDECNFICDQLISSQLSEDNSWQFRRWPGLNETPAFENLKAGERGWPLPLATHQRLNSAFLS
ncbi:uncharacterized protein LOC5515572 isoform X2 [Nematostella vectensis]|uniref:uncharacterized protein LOC5515572 isoform X2 n=1 Tax=Nematostella vectensis TaxID=45351 RepID=UPI002077242E|nr:uncharacterized protein LOC5515572 isoform X2 [Nematostella vectensis]